jgi:Family of unknown function (DUF6521)
VTAWTKRSSEERGLLSPSFCALLLWHAARGHSGDAGVALPFETTFLVLPMVLHRETRESMPTAVTTSLAVWLEEHSLARSRIADRSRTLVPFTKEGLSFGGLHGFLLVDNGSVGANLDWKKKVTTSLRTCTDEVRVCAKRAEFVGKWFAKTGSAATVMALIGVRP